jgi:lipid II:glycine glycyltransferase (peptidoglycan interpeptide bridge formation enzyme)
MEVKSFLTGKRGVSLPFSDHCGPILSNGITPQEIIDFVTTHGKKSGWKYIEFRETSTFLKNEPPSEYFFGHILNLSEDVNKIFFSFKESTRRNIRKADREGVKVGIFSSLESMKEFYRLNCITRRHHGLPPQPYYFFKKVHEHIISKNLGFVVLASHNNKIIAGAVYFHYGDKAFYKYGAFDRQFQHLRANNLVMWEAIQWYSQNGYKILCFGRTEPENKGLRQFKAGWGTKEQIINYHKYDLRKESFVKNSYSSTGLYNKIFSLMPIPLLRITGAILYKHIG